MISPELRKRGLKLIKQVAESSDDVRQLLHFLDTFLGQSPSWTDEDNLMEARGILCSISILIGRRAKVLNMVLTNERTPRVKAWFNYGGSTVYLNDLEKPLDLVTFRGAMGETLSANKRPQEEVEFGGEKDERVADIREIVGI